MLKYFLFFFFTIRAFSLCAQIELEAKNNLIDHQKLAQLNWSKGTDGSMKIAKEAGELTFEVSTNIYFENQYGLSVNIPLQVEKINKGEKLLIAFQAKTLEASLETDEAKVLWQLDVSDTPKDRIRTVISIGREWNTYYIPIEAAKAINKKNIRLALQFGFPPQKFLIKEIGLYHFDTSISLEELPKTIITYLGMEADAIWRKAAIERIDSIRKGDISIIVNKNGEALENVGIAFELIDHHFKWGAAVRVDDLLDDEVYQSKIKNAFNEVVLENDLKMKHFDKTQSKEDIIKAIDQLRKKGISVKGHVLVWPGYRHLTEQIKNSKNDPSKVNILIQNHVANILAATEGKITHWDVVNEAYTNTALQDITGSEEILYAPFRYMKEKYPNVGRFINEYGIINRGGLNKTKQQWYYDYAKRIDEHTNGALDGIGIQSHIGTDLTPPTRVLDLLDFYGQLNKKISISEFTMDLEDPLVRQMYTEDFILATFSHPSVSEFLFWGMVKDKKNKVDIYNEDGSLGSMGRAFFNLVHGLWKTKVSSTTDASGCINARGFYGTYEYTYLINGHVRKGKFKHLPGQKTTVNIDIP